MKVLKKANQKNVGLDTEMYTVDDVVRMMSYKTVVWFKEIRDENGRYKTMERTYDTTDVTVWEIQKAMENEEIRVYLDDKKEIKVINVDGYYYTVVTDNDSNMLYVKL